MTAPTGLARLALIPLDRTSQWGLSRDELLTEAGLAAGQLDDPDARVPLAAIVRLWRAIVARLPDPALGLRLGTDVRVREFGLVGYTMAFSPTLASALKRLTRYDRIVSDALVVELEPDPAGGATWVRVDVQPALRAFRPAADGRLATVLSVCRELAAAPVNPLTVQFPYRRPGDVSPFERFFRAPLEFGALSTALLFADTDLARPVVAGDSTLIGYLESLADQLLATLGEKRTMRDELRRVLMFSLSEGVPNLDRVARSLGLGGRTLQRRLREEGTTFAAVLDELRHEMAQPLLREGRLAVSEVAFLLGYDDPGSFQRAFRRRTGQSPRAFRRSSV